MLFKLISASGRRFIFLDEFQNIFGHFEGVPDQKEFSTFNLSENCRNSKHIVQYLEKVVGSSIQTFEGAPQGESVETLKFDDNQKLISWLNNEIKDLVKSQKIDLDQILILFESGKSDSCLSDLNELAGHPMKALDNKARFQKNAINFSGINTFKGLEADIVFIIWNGKNGDNAKMEKIYTMASRARYKLQILSTVQH